MILCCGSLTSYMSAFIVYINASVQPAKKKKKIMQLTWSLLFVLDRKWISWSSTSSFRHSAKASWNKSMKNRQVLCQTRQTITADQPVWWSRQVQSLIVKVFFFFFFLLKAYSQTQEAPAKAQLEKESFYLELPLGVRDHIGTYSRKRSSTWEWLFLYSVAFRLRRQILDKRGMLQLKF